MTRGVNMPQLKVLLGGKRVGQIRQVAARYGDSDLLALKRIFDAGVRALAEPDDPVATRPFEPGTYPNALHISGYGE